MKTLEKIKWIFTTNKDTRTEEEKANRKSFYKKIYTKNCEDCNGKFPENEKFCVGDKIICKECFDKKHYIIED